MPTPPACCIPEGLVRHVTLMEWAQTETTGRQWQKVYKGPAQQATQAEQLRFSSKHNIRAEERIMTVILCKAFLFERDGCNRTPLIKFWRLATVAQVSGTRCGWTSASRHMTKKNKKTSGSFLTSTVHGSFTSFASVQLAFCLGDTEATHAVLN